MLLLLSISHFDEEGEDRPFSNQVRVINKTFQMNCQTKKKEKRKLQRKPSLKKRQVEAWEEAFVCISMHDEKMYLSWFNEP